MTDVMEEFVGTALPAPAGCRDHGGMITSWTATDEHGLELVDVTKSFGPVRAVCGVDLSLARGDTVALLGPNGAGKSTVLDMVLGLVAPDTGSISVLGRSPATAVAAGMVSGMLQTASLIRDLTVRELVTMMASLYPAPMAVPDALALAGVSDLGDRRAHKLSGGQTQRVRFAIAIVANPELLVLDEPTVSLDVEARLEFWHAIRAFAATGRTVVFATHYLDEADASADRIVLMAHGRVIADGPATEIKAHARVRTIRATLPDVDLTAVTGLCGVDSVERHGDAVMITSRTADETLRWFLSAYPAARDIELRGAGLDEAFLELTATPATLAPSPETSQ